MVTDLFLLPYWRSHSLRFCLLPSVTDSPLACGCFAARADELDGCLGIVVDLQSYCDAFYSSSFPSPPSPSDDDDEAEPEEATDNDGVDEDEDEDLCSSRLSRICGLDQTKASGLVLCNDLSSISNLTVFFTILCYTALVQRHNELPAWQPAYT